MASYCDMFVLLLRYAQQRGKNPSSVELTDISAKFLASFLDHLEQERHNSVRSRNIRLAAVRSFLKFAARRDPAHLRVIEQALRSAWRWSATGGADMAVRASPVHAWRQSPRGHCCCRR